MNIQHISLRRIFEGLQGDHTFASLEEFIEWGTRTGHKTHFALYKLDTTKPHSPGNSYWYHDYKPTPNVVSRFCKDCDRPCPTAGCLNYRTSFIANWNKNICRKPKKIVPDGEMVFCYEHPDMVREGIVFEGSGSM